MDNEFKVSEASVTTPNAIRFRMIETYLWSFVSLAVAGRVLYFSLRYPQESSVIMRDYYWDIVVAGLVFIFPIVFRLIFGLLPLEFVRQSRNREQRPSIIHINGNYVGSALPGTNSPSSAKQQNSAGEVTGAQSLLLDFATNSRSLAKGIYGRAGVYLLVGVLVAFSGLVFFYSQTGGLVASTDISTLLFVLAPKFGILFFVEFVALFFLRQYRSAMDEFRYYEAVARTREEVAALLDIAKEAGSPLEPLELIKNDAYFSKGNVLEKNQTTEIIEARKLEKNEIDLLEKIVETLAKAKK